MNHNPSSGLSTGEKLALTRRSYAAISGQDIDALIPLYHPECEWRNGPMGAAFGDAFRGHDGLRELISELEAGFESFTVMIDEVKDTPEGALLLRWYSHARSRATQMELAIPAYWQRIEFRDGVILSVEMFDKPPAGWDVATPMRITRLPPRA